MLPTVRGLMSFAFLPLYTGDYRRDTQHLTPARHGIYLLLLFHCWDTRGPVPLDEQECAGIANCRSADEIEALRYILSRFFVKMDDGHYNERMQREIERAEVISGARSTAGRKGYEAKAQAIAKQVLSNCQASATTPTPTLTSTPTSTKSKALSGRKTPDSPIVSQEKADTLRQQAVSVLTFLNAKAGRNFKPVAANVDPIVTRFREGYTAQDCKSVIAKKVREWKGDDKMNEYLRPKTLFNRTNFANYEGELVPQPEESDGLS